MSNQHPTIAWINARETCQDSLAYGEVVVPKVNVWQHSGPPPKSGNAIVQISHGTRVTVRAEEEEPSDHRKYYEVSSEQVRGWVLESFVAWRWSCFTFLGTLSPSEACKTLEAQLHFGGMDLLIRESGFAIVTEGHPAHFDSINLAASRFISRIANAQVPLTIVALKTEFTNWVEIPFGDDGQRTVGFLSANRGQKSTISKDQIETAHSIVPLMATVPYLDLALSDLSQALAYPQHAPIFLARAIEAIENYFSGMVQKGAGKEAVMQQSLGVQKSDVEYVIKRANASHRRHASRDATAVDLPHDELAECFKRTASIVSVFVAYLEKGIV